MPHVGKLYPVSPARDFSKHVPDFRAQMPVGMMLMVSGATGPFLSHLNGGLFESSRADYDYSVVVVRYNFSLPSFGGGFRPFTATWHLLHTEDFGTWTMQFDQGGFCPILYDAGTPPAASVCNWASWHQPKSGGCIGYVMDFGTSTIVRPMTWEEATLFLNLPTDLRF